MQKDIQNISVDYPWKVHTEDVAFYNNSGEYSNSETSKNGIQPVNLGSQQPILHINESGNSLGVEKGEKSLENTQTIRPQQSYHDPNVSNEVVGENPIENDPTNHDSECVQETSLDSLKTSNPAADNRSSGRHINKHKSVSGTKRAAQNRSAQKAFRERREKYVKDLENTALQVVEMQKTIDQLRQENADLRDYTLALQNRLLQLNPPDTNHMP